MTELVGESHQQDAAGARLDVLFGGVGRQRVEERPQHRLESLHRRLDRDLVELKAEQSGAFGRILQAFPAGVGGRHHHAAHLIRPERVRGDRRRQRRVDAAGEPDDDTGKAVLSDIVAQAENEGAVDRLQALFKGRHLATLAVPNLVVAPLPVRQGDARLESGHLGGQGAVGIEHEGAAVEHQLVLPADLVDIDERQSRLDHAGNGKLHALVVLVPFEGRAVDHDQQLGGRLLKALGNVLDPHVFADHDTEAHALEVDRARQRPRLEDADFIENAVVGQLVLAAHRRHLAVRQKEGGVEHVTAQGLLPAPVLAPGRPDQKGRTAVGRFQGQGVERRLDLFEKMRFQHQVLGRIATEHELAGDHKVGAKRCGLRPRVPQAA